MKMNLILALAGLAIGFAVSTLAQEKDAVDPQTRQQLEAIDKYLTRHTTRTTQQLLLLSSLKTQF
jgi:hypothetical protein